MNYVIEKSSDINALIVENIATIVTKFYHESRDV